MNFNKLFKAMLIAILSIAAVCLVVIIINVLLFYINVFMMFGIIIFVLLTSAIYTGNKNDES